MQNLDRLYGIIPALVTPLTAGGKVDAHGLGRIVHRAIAGGVHGLLVLGTSGEGTMLPADEKARAIAAVVEAAGGRVPVLAGTGALTTDAAIANTRQAAELGADFALALPPFYYPLSQAALADYFRTLAEAAPLPVLVYNIPQLTKISAAPDTVAALAQHPNIVGIKDSSGDFLYFQAMSRVARSAQFKVFQGRGPLALASLAVGADGAITPTAQVEPAVEVAVLEAWQAGDLERARAAQNRLSDYATLFNNYAVPVNINVKAALKLLGVIEHATSVHPLPELNHQQLDQLQHQLQLLAAARQPGQGADLGSSHPEANLQGGL